MSAPLTPRETDLLEALNASVGRMMNIAFDLESGASKATVIRRLDQYIALTRAAADRARGEQGA